MIRYMNINNDKHAIQVEFKEEIDWGYQAVNDFFKEKNQQ